MELQTATATVTAITAAIAAITAAIAATGAAAVAAIAAAAFALLEASYAFANMHVRENIELVKLFILLYLTLYVSLLFTFRSRSPRGGSRAEKKKEIQLKHQLKCLVNDGIAVDAPIIKRFLGQAGFQEGRDYTPGIRPVDLYALAVEELVRKRGYGSNIG